MELTYYGQSCFDVVIKGKKILFDPFITPNPLAKNIDIEKIEADFIFVSHGHGDHIADCVAIAQRTNALVVSSYEVINWLEQQGLKNTHSMNTGGCHLFEFGNVKCVVAHHSSSMPDGTYGGNPLGFVFMTEERNFYYSGDTALTLDMQLIPRLTNLNFSILPIGDNYTMNVEDAIHAAEFVKCHVVIGVHYNTFELIKIDTEKAQEDFRAAGKTLLLPAIGETIAL
ncbi:MAG: metal-dependent hydrolase [Chitinophagaceae bacterium]|nr:metal-dependent hydrolase [Chitinophagaceae bacterium]